jgi:hypothetical protein
MNRILTTLVLAATLTSPLINATDLSAGSLTWSCSRAGVASYAEIKIQWGNTNFYQAKQAQEHIYQVVRRTCQRDGCARCCWSVRPRERTGSGLQRVDLLAFT